MKKNPNPEASRPITPRPDAPPSAVDIDATPIIDTTAQVPEALINGEPEPAHEGADATPPVPTSEAGAPAPALVMLLSKHQHRQVDRGHLIIVSRQPNMRRANMVHPGIGVYARDWFSPEQMTQLIAEPLLEIIEIT